MTFSRIAHNAAHAVLLASGWRRAGIAFLAGACSVLAMAPFGFWPILFLTFPVLVWLVDGSAGRFRGCGAAAVAGWCFGFGYFVAGLYWIGHAFLVDAKTFGWLLPIAVSGLPAYLGLFTALGLALARLIWVGGAERILALAATLTLAEWLRGKLLSGFPWNAFGYALAQPLPLAQSFALIGLWGLTFLAVAIFAAPAVFADERTITPRPWRPAIIGLVVLAGLTGYGAVRLWQNPTTFVADVKLRIMQPNLQQDQKFNYGAKTEVMNRYLRLSDLATTPQSSGVRDATHLIWPESAFPFLLAREPEAMAQIADLLPPGTVLITGAIRAGDTPPGQRITQAYNSVYVIDHDGSILGIYDKVHLVPFGEYLPLQNLLERIGLVALTKMRGGFLAGDRRRSMTVPRAPKFLPLVCYEAIFPGAVPPEDRPGWLLNVTNDGWFGISTGPHQHFQQAQMLAIAEGLPVVRAANTGISAVVDPFGRIVRALPLGAEGVLDSALPRATAPTIYARYGDSVALALGVLALFLVMRRKLRA